MSNWTGYRMALELDAPVHVGWRAVGNLKQTRPYIPGRAIWGALTARLARDFLNANYRKAKQDVHDCLRFTYLYPSTDPGSVIAWPWGSQQGEFEWLFLGSYTSASLRDGRSAAPGLLHEIEFIAPRARNGKKVYLLGYCWWNGQGEFDLKALWGSAQFGGERTYGFGRIRGLEKWETLSRGDPIFGFQRAETDGVVLHSAQSHTLLSHTVSESGSYTAIALEPVVGRDIDPAGRYNLSEALIAYAPGTKLDSAASWKIGNFGYWERFQLE